MSMLSVLCDITINYYTCVSPTGFKLDHYEEPQPIDVQDFPINTNRECSIWLCHHINLKHSYLYTIETVKTLKPMPALDCARCVNSN
jgi:hypothetical protein